MLEILEEISNTPGKNDKLQLLKDNSGNSELADLLDATFNYNRKFFIKKIPLCKHILRDPRDKHTEFMKLLSDLETGQHRGGAAETMVQDFLHQCTDDEYKWYSYVLRKDLKAGFSAKTAVKAGFKNIPLFDVMLAKDANLCKKLAEIVAGGVWVSPKLDGYRCLAVIDNGSATLYSRNGKVYTNFPSVEESLLKCFPTGQHVFDGEIMSDDFQSMQKSAFASKRQTTVGDVYYSVFGYIDYKEWVSQKFKMKTDERMKLLNIHGEQMQITVNNIKLVKQHYTEDLAQIYSMQAKWEAQGYEGAMALPNIPYYLGKKMNRLLKFKTMETQDCIITDMYEGEKGSRLEGMMGGVVVTQENSVSCECGSGWNDEDRTVMWANPELYVGQMIECKYQELTKDDQKMRFPVFIRFRHDK